MNKIYEKQMDWYKLNNLEPRPSQKKAAYLIAKHWNKKYHICSAPTGVGKQFIALAAGFAAGRSYILTHTKQLQDQYINGPGDVVDLRGRSNYKCGINPTMTAADAPCISFKQIIRSCAMKKICPYINQKKKALAADVLSTNYAYFLLSRAFGPFADVEPRDMFIADEGHILENQLVSFAEILLDPEELRDHYDVYDMTWNFIGSKTKNNRLIVDSMYEALKEKMNEKIFAIEEIFESNGISENSSDKTINGLSEHFQRKIKMLQKESDKLGSLIHKLDIFYGSVNKSETEKWIISSDNEKNTLTLTPIKAEDLFHPYCGQGTAKKYLFLSATIGDFEEFADELGLPMKECNCVEVDTTFDKEASPIVHISVGKFSYNEIEKTLPKAVKVIDQLLNEHQGDKGIIHSTNYRISNYISQKSMFRNRLIYRDMDKGRYSINNNTLIERHQESKKASVLLSPSMGTGISLDDELARFQIIIKLPFMSIGDPRVKYKMNHSGSWYRNKMWQEIMQAAGRATRSEEDYCVTYILDESMQYFYVMDKDKLPEWFKERLIF